MPWDTVTLNDGNTIPGIGFGTWKLGNGQGPTDQVDQAISVGFAHVDTAQGYANEVEAGIAIRESGLSREDIFITTKWSGAGHLDMLTSCHNSLKYLGVAYVDLYLIHFPTLAVPDIPTIWKQIEDIKAQGLAKSIGISNFNVNELAILLASAKVKPAANQIELHPYVYAEQREMLEYAAKHNIAIEAYSPLYSLTSVPGGPLDAPVEAIAKRLGVTDDQVLLAWAKAKGAVVLTTSSKKARLEGYMHAGDLTLTSEDIANIEAAGAKGAKQSVVKVYARRLAITALAGAFAFKACEYFGVSVL